MGFPRFVRPILNKNGILYVSSGWGDPRDYRGGIHNGLDAVAPIGVPVMAAADGVISFAGNVAPDAAGIMIVIDHGGGWYTRYLHLSRIAVSKGTVRAGQVIGYSGASGIAQSAAHLHFDIRVKGAAEAEYRSKYGIPSNSEMTSSGRGVPAEPLIPVDAYDPNFLKRLAARGISTFAGGGLGWLLIMLGVGAVYFGVIRGRNT